MSWVDPLVEGIKKRFAQEIAAGKTLVIRDEKTLSGRVHIGSLRGVAIHGLVAQVLTEQGIANKFLFELNDFDPVDDLPPSLKSSYKEHMGKPLYTVPAHEKGFENYPMVFGEEVKEVINTLGFPVEFYMLRPLYVAGKFNDTIRAALDHASLIRKIYKEVSGGGKPDDWYPLNVVCEQCGKIGTTQVTGWDGSNVTYECKKNMVKWAEGCGYKGTTSPFDGNAKLPWKAEWAAKWNVIGVHIEGAGKDHSAAGGSREIAVRISEEVFKYPNPFDVPYEFFNIQGKKMSASKGLGASAKEIADLLTPTLLKLLLIRKQPNHPIDFDPEGKMIPNLFDEYDRLADHYFKRHPEPFEGFARTFQLSHIDLSHPPNDAWHMRFTVLSFILQMPHLNLEKEAEKLKGSPLNAEEKKSLEERAAYVRKWLDHYANDEYRYTILSKIPDDLTLDGDQKKSLRALIEALSEISMPWEGAKIHETIHKVKSDTGIEPKKLFQPLYTIFLGRESGPQIGWFLSTFDRSEVLSRLKSATI